MPSKEAPRAHSPASYVLNYTKAMHLDIYILPLGPLQTNGYLLCSDKQAVMIDPGEEVDKIEAKLEQTGCSLQAVWLTHAHFDHVGALNPLLERYDVPFYMHPAEQPLLASAVQSAQRFLIDIPKPPQNFQPLEAGQVLMLGKLPFSCLFTPGHAPGHIAFYQAEQEVVFAGDALFRDSIGRTDLPLADHDTLLHSIHSQLLTLPEESKVYSGHGLSTTIGREKRYNPFL